ncbi:hypothetical protein K469DRAFT_84555 [Zopfia rhizophila CBS 207.26]|uniref:Uncharacterized protein n=1 Tax=Zopfia rhizophila CBS 207.26 TaxID=1314779 RepID=A0A6A6EBU9_9PEZI|nr:hypothetical protein K469DRAFT_84555 [Zopfia rhizophila CBS 207.26]
MVNQIYRYGIMSKKTIDGSGTARMHGSRKYWRNSRITTPDGALIIHRDDSDPHPNNCDAFIHPSCGSKERYRGENGSAYTALVPLAKLAVSATNCAFCSILYQGLYLRRYIWSTGWARYQRITSHQGYDPVEAEEQQPWTVQYKDEIEPGKEINEDKVGVNVTFPKSQKCLIVRIDILDQSAPHHSPSEPKTTEDIRKTLENNDPSRKMGELEFYTVSEYPSPWTAFGPAPHIQPEVISEACINHIRIWLRECVLLH